jgi:PTH1 family peptidyl-tRNA hydrolase
MNEAVELKGPFLILGLGNPGRQYKRSRHNVGFMLLDQLADKLELSFTRKEADALIAKGHFAGHLVILAKPQTFMNLSGRSAGTLSRYYRVPLQSFMVVFDDIDLPLGNIRIRPKGGTGGHRGMESVVDNLNSGEFARLRIGIDRPSGRKDPADYVLEDFSDEEFELIQTVLHRCVGCILQFVEHDLEAAMNRCNPEQE